MFMANLQGIRKLHRGSISGQKRKRNSKCPRKNKAEECHRPRQLLQHWERLFLESSSLSSASQQRFNYFPAFLTQMEKGVSLTSLHTSREGSEQTPVALTPTEGCTCQKWHDKRKDLLYNMVLTDGTQKKNDPESIFQEINVTNRQNKTWRSNRNPK